MTPSLTAARTLLKLDLSTTFIQPIPFDTVLVNKLVPQWHAEGGAKGAPTPGIHPGVIRNAIKKFFNKKGQKNFWGEK